ncbi:MAG: PD40 domain-containing protein [Flavobacteriales bacterium]|nr:PD40 domain-containing protein [Flavobacteriales bacterium]
MVIKKYTATILLIILVVGSAYSQDKLSNKEEKKILEKAEFYYIDDESHNIPKALKLFEKLSKNKPEDPYYKLMTGICYSHMKNRKAEALEILLQVKVERVDYNEVNFYLGRAYAVNHRFDEAISTYQDYIASDDVSDDRKAEARQNIIYCENAKLYMKDSLEVDIKNIGSPINTEYSEYVPAITPDESMMIYTYRGIRSKGGLLDPTGKPDNDGAYYEDIMVSYKFGDDWLEPESIADNINTVGHDASIALSVDGQMLFIYNQDKKNGGDIYSSVLVGEDWSKPEKLKGEVNTEAWEGSATLTSDGKMLYFASDREGGFGGRDLYSATLQPDNTWGEIKNLGPVINTRFDDDAPFIHPDRRTMYFSSKGHNSMGDYDIFYTYLSDEGWDEPENVGYPINTIDGDRYYVLSADAKTGYYSTGGRSEDATHDIYTVSPGHFGKRPILALIVGVTQADGELVEADITVTNDETGELAGKFKSNSTSGKYMLALTPGNKYKIAIEVEGYETKIDYIDIESLATYVEVEHDFNLYSKENVVGISDDLDPLQGKIDNQIEKYRRENTKEGYEEMIYEKILNERGDEKVAGVQYFLDADCIDVENTDPEILAKINTISYPDGTTKKIIGPFESLLASEIVKQNLVSKDSSCSNLEVKIDDNGTEKSFQQFYEEEYTKTDFSETKSIHDQLTGLDTAEVADAHDGTSAIDLEEIKDVDLENENLRDAAGKTITGLTFKVEIGAVTDTNDFKLQYLEKYGKITAKSYPDGKTRYTFGPFKTLVEAEEFRQMLEEKEAAQKDAFITVFVFGQRKKVADIPDKQREELGIPPKKIEEPSNYPCAGDVKDFSWFIGKDLNNKTVYDKLIATGGNSCAEGLEFKVQIAAYRFPKNYKWDHLKQYGDPLILDYPDEITRFTQGSFNTLGLAEVLRQKIIKSGQADAWITPFYNGKRILLEDLFEVNFYGKSVN